MPQLARLKVSIFAGNHAGINEEERKHPSYKIAQIKNAAVEKDFEFYRFEYFVSDIDHLKHPHRHDHFAIFFVTRGTGTML